MTVLAYVSYYEEEVSRYDPDLLGLILGWIAFHVVLPVGVIIGSWWIIYQSYHSPSFVAQRERDRAWKWQRDHRRNRNREIK